MIEKKRFLLTLTLLWMLTGASGTTFAKGMPDNWWRSASFPPSSPVWWTLTDAVSPLELRILLQDVDLHQARYAEAYPEADPAVVADILEFLDGRRSPQMIPMWLAFDALAARHAKAADQAFEVLVTAVLSKSGVDLVVSTLDAYLTDYQARLKDVNTSLETLHGLVDDAAKKIGDEAALAAFSIGDVQTLSEATGNPLADTEALFDAALRRPAADAAPAFLLDLSSQLTAGDWAALREHLFKEIAPGLSLVHRAEAGGANAGSVIAIRNARYVLDRPLASDRSQWEVIVGGEAVYIGHSQHHLHRNFSAACFVYDDYHDVEHQDPANNFIVLRQHGDSVACAGVRDVFPRCGDAPPSGVEFVGRVAGALLLPQGSITNSHSLFPVQSDCRPTYRISANVTGLATGELVHLRLHWVHGIEGTGLENLTVGNGSHPFPELPDGTSYNLTIAGTTATSQCTASSTSGSILGADVTIDISCSQQFSISFDMQIENELGQPISGGVDAGVQLQAVAPGGSALPPQSVVASSSRSYTFPEGVPDDSEYSVDVGVVQNGECSVDNGSGVVEGADVDDIDVTCLAYLLDPGNVESCTLNPELCYTPPVDCVLQFDLVAVWVEIIETPGLPHYHFTFVWWGTLTCTGQSPLLQTQVHQGPIIYTRNDPDSPWSGNATVRGVARHDDHGVASLQFFLDGSEMSLDGLQTGLHEPRTCDELPAAGCDANSGFAGILDTTQLDDGFHTLVIAATSAGDPEVTSFNEITFEVENGGGCGGQAPTVTITEPVDGASLVEGSQWIQVTAGPAADYVDFTVDGVFHHRDSTFPFRYSWAATPGSFTLSASAATACGTAFSAPIAVDVSMPPSSCTGDQDGPDITDINPPDGATVQAGELTVTANATDPSGVGAVRFIFDGGVTCIVASVPFVCEGWSPPIGSRTIEIVALDGCDPANLSTEQAVIEVVSASPCTSDFDGPAAWWNHPSTTGAQVVSGETITVSAGALDPSGLDEIVLSVDGSVLVTCGSSPCAVDWTPSGVGSRTLRLETTDDCGNLTTRTRPVEVIAAPGGGNGGCGGDNEPPDLSIEFPNGGIHWFGDPIEVEVAASDPSGIERVDLFVDGALESTMTATAGNGHYTYTWLPPLPGTYLLQAQAADGCGNVATSSAVEVRIRVNIDE